MRTVKVYTRVSKIPARNTNSHLAKFALEKRQRYSIKSTIPSRHPGNRSSSIAKPDSGGYKAASGEPQCSYMYGGLGDLRRETYLCKSPLQVKDNARYIYTHFSSLCCCILSLYHRKNVRARSAAGESKHFAVPAVESSESKSYCNAATAAASVFKMTTLATGVKINPLCESSSHGNTLVDCADVQGNITNPVFYGQRTKIRKTKEQEMISAILEATSNGNSLQKH